ncbi:MAG: hypothetical protein BJ554DRAFT_3509 [Olpidium bornovanus]|uniref:Uncharacterized protein n=1 Tax=Olpidium bornovanus TaxID=278681 RepID=A0A8H8DFW2_9FUNG|nr:MAG: hypothetical protein BJ554DRAFT_3509 [Olpidium bornovanus]
MNGRRGDTRKFQCVLPPPDLTPPLPFSPQRWSRNRKKHLAGQTHQQKVRLHYDQFKAANAPDALLSRPVLFNTFVERFLSSSAASDRAAGPQTHLDPRVGGAFQHPAFGEAEAERDGHSFPGQQARGRQCCATLRRAAHDRLVPTQCFSEGNHEKTATALPQTAARPRVRLEQGGKLGVI